VRIGDFRLNVRNLHNIERSISLYLTKLYIMKKIVAFAALVGLLTACSQYTCPTYAKKEVKKESPSPRI
jgi:hypothetical protein